MSMSYCIVVKQNTVMLALLVIARCIYSSLDVAVSVTVCMWVSVLSVCVCNCPLFCHSMAIRLDVVFLIIEALYDYTYDYDA